MKRFTIMLAFVCFATAGAWAQAEMKASPATQAAASTAEITFSDSSHDFGDITQGDKVEYTFSFTNSGTTPLILSRVQTTCGCTATDWPRDPIAPGEEGSIKATFNSRGKMGRQNKVITVYSNAKNSPARVSLISNVLPQDQKAAATPAK